MERERALGLASDADAESLAVHAPVEPVVTAPAPVTLAATRKRSPSRPVSATTSWPEPVPTPVRVCASPWAHVCAGRWEYRERDRRYVCRVCHPRTTILREPSLTLAAWHALPLDTLASDERRRCFALARASGFPSVRLAGFAASVGAGEHCWRAFARAGSSEMVSAACVALGALERAKRGA